MLDFCNNICYIININQERIFYFKTNLRATGSTSLDIILSWLIRASCPFCYWRFKMPRGVYIRTEKHCGKNSPNWKHGHSKNGKQTKTYKAWADMKSRCYYPKYKYYKYWGGRGISVCERWNSFKNFLFDMGECPAGFMLDRIDNDGNYELSNCRWTDITTSARNRRAPKLTREKSNEIRELYSKGNTQTEIANQFNISQMTVSDIINGNMWN